jgi:uncharacterized protein
MHPKLVVPLEIKSLKEREFEGHGSVFGNVDLGGDIVLPGAFKRTLAQHKKAGTLPQMFWMHDPALVPGKWNAMDEDNRGLAVAGELAETQLGRDMRTLANMKAVRGLSIGYQIKDADYDDDGNRLLKEVDLWEVSLVSLAMNPLARIEASKSRLSRDGEYVPTEREFERCLRDSGYSRKVALMLVAKVFDGVDPRGILDGHLRDSGASEEEMAKEALLSVASKVYGAAIR